jgi:hypothetical protein
LLKTYEACKMEGPYKIKNIKNATNNKHDQLHKIIAWIQKTKIPSERQLKGFVCRAMPKEWSVPKVNAHLENEWVFILGTLHFEVIIQYKT